MIQAKCQIVEKKHIAEKIFVMVFEHAVIASKARPGQFVHINLGPGSVLRRPFSVYDTYRDTFSILFQVVGSGTNRLATYRPAQSLDVIGPLGHGYPLEGEKPVLIGGGMGLASLKLLHKRFIDNKKDDVRVILGFSSNICAVEWPEADVCTEDGSLGKKGLVTELLKEELKSGADVVYACGPEAMLEKVSDATKDKKIPTYLCLERYMACGVGACLSCVCETKTGLKRVCREGPVFKSDDIIFNETGEKKNSAKKKKET